jgi:hypothetical protein
LGNDSETWHHYALAFSTSSTGYVGEIYVDGHFKKRNFIQMEVQNLFYRHFRCNCGQPPLSSSKIRTAENYLGSIDEVRLWKTTRDAKQIGVNYFYDVGGGGNTDTTKVNNDDPLGFITIL